jgi:hypothetical protein
MLSRGPPGRGGSAPDPEGSEWCGVSASDRVARAVSPPATRSWQRSGPDYRSARGAAKTEPSPQLRQKQSRRGHRGRADDRRSANFANRRNQARQIRTAARIKCRIMKLGREPRVEAQRASLIASKPPSLQASKPSAQSRWRRDERLQPRLTRQGEQSTRYGGAADTGQDDRSECPVAIAPMTLHKKTLAQQSIIRYDRCGVGRFRKFRTTSECLGRSSGLFVLHQHSLC